MTPYQFKLLETNNESYCRFLVNRANGNEYERFMSISIKWDGCIDIMFDNPIHFCGQDGIEEFQNLLKQLVNETGKEIGREVEEWNAK